MLIDDTEEYAIVWDKVYDKLKLNPSCSYRGHSLTVDPPFEIEGNFAVYGIDKMSDSQIDSMQDMFISSNERTIEVFTFEDFKEELERCMNIEGGNEIWCSMQGTSDDYPSLSILVDKTAAVVNYFGDEDGNDTFASLGDSSQDGTLKF